jgi:hypothetical protein
MDTHKGCAYEAGSARLARHGDLYPGGKHQVWDIEDLNMLGTFSSPTYLFSPASSPKNGSVRWSHSKSFFCGLASDMG